MLVIFKTHFNIIPLVRCVNISVAVMYCYSYLPLRTRVLLFRFPVLTHIMYPMMMGLLVLKDEATAILLNVDNNLPVVTA